MHRFRRMIIDGMMECDGFGLVAGSAGLKRDVRLAHWLVCKWASERENVGGPRVKPFREFLKPEQPQPHQLKTCKTVSPQAYEVTAGDAVIAMLYAGLAVTISTAPDVGV